MRKITILLALSLIAALAAGQEAIDTGPLFQYIDLEIENFENTALWTGAETDSREGLKVSLETRPGKPSYMESEVEQTAVLGVKFEFTQVDTYMVHIKPPAPIKLEHEPLNLTYWLYGSNFNHNHSVVISNKEGTELYTTFGGKMNWMGWKKVTSPTYRPGTDQKEIYFNGFYIHLDPLEITGYPYYLYIDGITLLTRRIGE